jgi:hypothetical protein
MLDTPRANPDQTTAETFHFRVNGGAESRITVSTGIYQFAALAIPAMTGNVDLPIEVEIWCPRLLPNYGPFRYEIYSNEFGNPSIRQMVKLP